MMAGQWSSTTLRTASAIDLNRRGVADLIGLSYADAASKFHSAIIEINHLIPDDAAAATRTLRINDSSGADAAADSLQFSVSQSITQQTALAPNAQADTYSLPIAGAVAPRIDIEDHNTFRVFDKAFLFSGELPQGEQGLSSRFTAFIVNESTLARLAAGVLFNTGLSHHLRGLAHLQSQALDFQRCLEFYRLSLKLFDGYDNGDTASWRLLLLAIHNNMAHIHRHTFDEHALTLSLDGLRRTLANGQSCWEDSHFMLNLLVTQDPEKQAASSA